MIVREIIQWPPTGPPSSDIPAQAEICSLDTSIYPGKLSLSLVVFDQTYYATAALLDRHKDLYDPVSALRATIIGRTVEEAGTLEVEDL